jgi:hypothetical protein
MQRVILVCGFLSLGLTAATLAQSVQKDSTPPAWLPKETVKKDTASRSKDLKSFISGLDPVVGGSVPGGKGKSTSLSTLVRRNNSGSGIEGKRIQKPEKGQET